jgi:exo-beta-1,3-glucanase (GH17 family)
LALNRRSTGFGSNTSLPIAGAKTGASAGAGAAAGTSLEGPPALAKSATFPGQAASKETFPPIRDPAKSTKNRFWKRFFFILVVVVILGAIAAGVVVGLWKSRSNGKSSSGGGGGSSASGSSGSDSEADGGTDSGDLDIKSPSVVHLLNNKNLHKTFMGMAYTAMNSQYPDCLNTPPIQNNVTLDLAVLGQLTNTLRLYGTDCNQTAMVLHAIDKLQLTDMKIWAGIWLNNNVTTNNRQIQQFWDIIDTYGTDKIKGVIVGNEVLFRQDLTLTQLEQYITDVRTNLTSRNLQLPVASADLGDNWVQSLAQSVDSVMSNVHPFFAGINPANNAASAWAYQFWQTHDVVLTPNPKPGQQIISEIGWPSQGGNDCGTAAGCPDATSGAVAGITEMNTFLDSWVCAALTNGTEYFWFEGIDEPWKIQFDTATEAWEDHWGLFTVNRVLKTGVTIPSCNGATVPAA